MVDGNYVIMGWAIGAAFGWCMGWLMRGNEEKVRRGRDNRKDNGRNAR